MGLGTNHPGPLAPLRSESAAIARARDAAQRCAARRQATRLWVVATSYDTAYADVTEQVLTKLRQLDAAFGAEGLVRPSLLIVDDAPGKRPFGRDVDRAFARAPMQFRGPGRLIRQPLFYGRVRRFHTKGLALREGFLTALQAGADVVVYVNLNDKVDARQIATGLWALFEHGAEAAIGSRAHLDGGGALGRTVLGNLKSRVYARIVREQLSPLGRYRDQNAPLKIFSARAARAIVEYARIDGVAFDAEWLLLLELGGFSVIRFPIIWVQRAGSRPPFFAIWSMLGDLRRLERAWRTGALHVSHKEL